MVVLSSTSVVEQLRENGFVMNADEERRSIIKEVIGKYANPNKAQSYVEENLDPALAKRWNMIKT